MNSDNSKYFINLFLKVFFVLFLILVVFPFIVDHIMHAVGDGLIPRSNSVIVFKDLFAKKGVINRFYEIIKKIIIFM